MSTYIINSTDSNSVLTISSAAEDSSTDLKFYGAGNSAWGEGVDENFYRLLENFAAPQKDSYTFPIDALNQSPDYFVVDDDHSDVFKSGKKFKVTGSTGNNGVYTITNVDTSIIVGKTTIYVFENILSAVLNGNITISDHNSAAVNDGLLYPWDFDILTNGTRPKDQYDISSGFGINSPANGQQWYNKTTKSMMVYDSVLDTWMDIGTGGGAFVHISGDTMTGRLTLSAAPLVDLHAATKKYVDDSITTSVGDYVLKAGDTMTGRLTLSADPVNPLHAVTKQYADGLAMGGGGLVVLTGDITGSGVGTVATTLSNTGISAGTYKSITIDAKGRATSGTNPTTLVGFGITDAQPLDGDLTAISALTGTGYARRTGTNTWVLDPGSGGGGSITLTGDVTGSGTGTVVTSLSNTGIVAGTYRSIHVDAKGRATSGTNPTTLSGYGITDAQPLDGDLTAIANLVGTTGLARKTAANTWMLDTATYLTSTTSLGIQRSVLYDVAGTFTYTSHAGCKSLLIFVTGGGAGGGLAQGGGAGGTAIKVITFASPITVTVTVGAGGAGRTTGGGFDGETSSFGAYCSALGGNGKQGGTGVGGGINIPGGDEGGRSFWADGGVRGFALTTDLRLPTAGYYGSGGGQGYEGGPTWNQQAGKAGGDGLVFILEFA